MCPNLIQFLQRAVPPAQVCAELRRRGALNHSHYFGTRLHRARTRDARTQQTIVRGLWGEGGQMC